MSKIKLFSLLVPFLFILSSAVAVSAATIRYVPDPYLTIQAAVNVADPGDTIIVRDGIYTENVDVSKPLTIHSENGADKTTVQAKDLNDAVFEVTADSVTIEGFTVVGGSTGISLYDAHHCYISKNAASGNLNHGIDLRDSSNNTLTNNTASANSHSGIVLWDSSNNTLTDNTASDNMDNGIRVDDSSNGNSLTGNTASGNMHDGISLSNSSNNTLTDNTASGNSGGGISLNNSSSNTLTNNTASGNEGGEEFAYGIFLEGSSHNTLTGNDASDNAWSGISLSDSHWNLLTNNTALGNRANGIDLGGTDEDTGAFLGSNHNTLTGNTASGNLGEEETGCGIGLFCGSSDNTLTSNYVSGNKGGGIVLWYSSKNTLTGNTAESNQERARDGIQRLIGGGIVLLDSSNENLLTNNKITGNSGPGIVLGVLIGIPEFDGCNANELRDNIVSGNSRHGIELAESSNNTFTRNNVEGNLGSGINLISSSNNIIYLNNFIDNGQNALSDNSENTWISPDTITYTYAGLSSIYDAEGNGTGDTSYSIDADNDNYPLMQPFENYIASNGSTYISYLGNYWSDYYIRLVFDIPATIDLDPDTLNLKSKGEWITCYIELPEGSDVNDIDVGTVILDGVVRAEDEPTEVSDNDDDGIPDLMVKFDRSSVQEILEPGDEVEISVAGALTDGSLWGGTDIIRVIEGAEGETKPDQEITQAKFGLSQNYPNPFNPETTIEYDIEKDCDVTLKIYSLAGQLIKTLVDEYQTVGHYTITWYGDNEAGEEVASGVYFYRIKAGDKAAIKKMVVLK